MSQPLNHTDKPARILIVDDNPSIHEDFRKILGAKTAAQTHLENVESALFGNDQTPGEREGFRIDSAYQGQEALELVKKAMAEGDPYVLAFVDVRMPPGWDGIETLENIWKVSAETQAVVCTAYSDYSWDDMTRRFGQTDNLLILKKPFETVEVLQMAQALVNKWILGRQAKLRMDDLDRMVKQRTVELHASEERFSKAFQASPIPLAIIRCDNGLIIDSNESFSALTGLSAEQLRKKTAADLHLWEAISKGQPANPTTRLREKACSVQRNDGSVRQAVLSTEPFSLVSVECLLVIIEDITEQLKIEAQLRQAQKMEVIGRMAAGIAHEFNNLLTVIQGDVGLLQSANPSQVDSNALLDQIMQASQRAATFTRQLLAFSRKQVLQPRVLDLCEIMLRTRKMLSRLVGEKFEVKIHCETESVSVRADEGGLEQILMNLVLNARDAMPDGGTVEISAALVTLDEKDAARNPQEARPGRFACLRVIDHGSGMSSQVLSRIFDPFFTTKDVGKGTGLGLSTIHGIVKQHEGWVEVTSEVGKGSTFEVFLPSCDSTPAQAVLMEKPAALAEGKGEVILVVEDEVAVRELACMALRKRGYQVLNAPNGPAAIEVWQKSTTAVNLLLTDMVMPNGMSGGELAKDLAGRNPKLKIIYTSGYSPEILKQDSLLAQGINFLPKPYDLPALLKAVRLCLDGGKLPQYEVRSGKTQTITTIS
jgi:two-component system cell cycle sensor histidine kinase/response regulator CckA